MTNHPNRRRDVTGDAEHDPAASNGNGALPGLRPNAAKIIGAAVAQALAETLPPLLAQAAPQYHCATCLADRLNWEIAHEADLRASVDQMQIAGQAMQPDDPRRAELNPFMFLPTHLLPSQDPADPHPEAVPVPQTGVTMAGGTLYCASHVPGVNRPGVDRPAEAPKRPLLVATTTLNPG